LAGIFDARHGIVPVIAHKPENKGSGTETRHAGVPNNSKIASDRLRGMMSHTPSRSNCQDILSCRMRYVEACTGPQPCSCGNPRGLGWRQTRVCQGKIEAILPEQVFVRKRAIAEVVPKRTDEVIALFLAET
jgi:hypothetical protein